MVELLQLWDKTIPSLVLHMELMSPSSHIDGIKMVLLRKLELVQFFPFNLFNCQIQVTTPVSSQSTQQLIAITLELYFNVSGIMLSYFVHAIFNLVSSLTLFSATSKFCDCHK